MAITRSIEIRSKKKPARSAERKPSRTDEITKEKENFLKQLASDIAETKSFQGILDRYARLGNPVSGREYHGMNNIWLTEYVNRMGYKDPRFVTFNQAKKYGLRLKKGEHATLINYYNKTETDLTEADVERMKAKLTAWEIQNKKKVTITIQKFFVFNGEQFENMPPVRQEEYTNERREAIIADIKKNLQKELKLEITGQGLASYAPKSDKITLPDSSMFRSSEAEARTLLHELAHSTMKEGRTNRSKQNLSYAEEECVAELASGLLYKEFGFKDTKDDDYTRNYIVGWSSDDRNPLHQLKEKPELLTRYINLAEQAASYIREHYISKELLLEVEKFPELEETQKKEEKKEVVRNKLTRTEDVSLTERVAEKFRERKEIMTAIDIVNEAKGEGKELSVKDVAKQIRRQRYGHALEDEGFSREEARLVTALPEKKWDAGREALHSGAARADVKLRGIEESIRVEREADGTQRCEAPRTLLAELRKVWNETEDYKEKLPADHIRDFKVGQTTFRFTAGKEESPLRDALLHGQENLEKFKSQVRMAAMKKAVQAVRSTRVRDLDRGR